jgi:hypothetical protein
MTNTVQYIVAAKMALGNVPADHNGFLSTLHASRWAEKTAMRQLMTECMHPTNHCD